MTYTVNTPFATQNPALSAVSSAIAAFKRLAVDEQLGLLWALYKDMGRSVTPAATGAARLQFAEGLLQQVKEMSEQEQLQFMRDLAANRSTPETRAYGVLGNNTKLAFWYQLAVLMDEGTVVPVPASYKLSTDAAKMFAEISQLDFGQQITVMRQAVVDMGIDPLA